MTRLLFLLAMAGLLAGLPWLVDPSVSAVARGQSGTVPDGPAYRFEELADGVHFAIGTGAMTVFSNSLVIINEDHVMLVDTSVTPAAARELVAQIQSELTAKPIRYVFNTHFHFDHSHGNQIFGDDVEIIGHDFVRLQHVSTGLDQRTNRSFAAAIPGQIEGLEAQVAAATDAGARTQLETALRQLRAHQNAIQETVVKAPNVTYSDTMTIHKGGREVQLHFVGRGHTGGDTIVLLPAERIAFTGDFLLGAPGAPRISYMGDAFIDEWPASLGRLKELDFDIMVPGHGQPFRERGQIDLYQRYLRDLWAQVADLRAQGLSAEDAAGRLDMSAYEPEYGSRVRNVDPRAVVRIYELLQIQMPL
jgi:glyoxylase-like metal-dependent hydrolase (beta-lactamase superfamily II)